MRRAARVDANQAEIVEALRRIGARVYLIKWPCDALVAYRGRWIGLEIKAPGGRLTKDQVKLIAECDAPVHVVQTPEEAVKCCL